jgi:hypothetical protein
MMHLGNEIDGYFIMIINRCFSNLFLYFDFHLEALPYVVVCTLSLLLIVAPALTEHRRRSLKKIAKRNYERLGHEWGNNTKRDPIR